MPVRRCRAAMLLLAACGPAAPEPSSGPESGDSLATSDMDDGSLGATGPTRLEDPAPTYRAIFGLEIDRNYLLVQKTVPSGHCLSLTMKPLLGSPETGLAVEFRDVAYADWSAHTLKVFATHEGCFGSTTDTEGAAVEADGWLEWAGEPCRVSGFVDVELPISEHWPSRDTFDFSSLPVDVYLDGYCD